MESFNIDDDFGCTGYKEKKGKKEEGKRKGISYSVNNFLKKRKAKKFLIS